MQIYLSKNKYTRLIKTIQVHCPRQVHNMLSEKHLAHLRIVMTSNRQWQWSRWDIHKTRKALSSHVVLCHCHPHPGQPALLFVSALQSVLPAIQFMLQKLEHCGSAQKLPWLITSNTGFLSKSRISYAAPLGAKAHSGATSLSLRRNFEFARISLTLAFASTSSSWRGFHSPRLLGISGVLVKVRQLYKKKQRILLGLSQLHTAGARSFGPISANNIPTNLDV